MTDVLDDAGARLSLRGAMDLLGESARRAGRPSLLWVAGVLYPSWGEYAAYAAAAFSESPILPSMDRLLSPDDGGLLWLLVFFAFFRLTPGLARLTPPSVWSRLAEGRPGGPRLRRAWTAGRGLTLSALGMWLLLFATMLVVLVAVLVPMSLAAGILGLDEPTAAVLLSPLLAFLLVYGVVLSLLHQLALHSLVHNRRGVASALLHAWRIARHAPRDTARAAAGDVVLSATVFLASSLVVALLGWTGPLAFGLQLALAGFAGVTRAGYWARCYRALGGLSPEDGVPGL